MTNDNTDGQTQDRAFGEIAEREDGEKPVLVEDKIKAKEEKTEVKSEVKEDKTDVKETEGEDESKTKEGEPQLTEKGTKLDPNPESAVHQQLANERKIRSQMEKVLADPKLLVEFAKKQGYDLSIAEAKEVIQDEKGGSEVKEFTAEDFESTEDVAKTFNTLQKQFEETRKADKAKILELETTIKELAGESHDQRVVNSVKEGVTTLSQLDELNPESENFIDGLEAKIVDEYKSLDYDENTGKYLGKYNIVDIGKKFIEIAKTGKKVGSLSAQTIVKDKSQGKITTSTTVKEEPSTDDLTPGDSIALGISRMFKNH